MKKLLLTLGVIVLLLWGATWHPATGQWVYHNTQQLEAALYGFDEQSIAVGDVQFSVYQRPATSADAPTLVLLHGYTASKELWLRFANQLSTDFNILIPDLPGHGKTGFDPQWSYRPSVQAARLEGLLNALAIEQATFIGNSMGGLIAANFALDYPQRLSALVVIDPAGVEAPEPSPAERLFRQGKSPFLIESWQDFKAFYAMTMAEPPYVPEFVLRGMAAEYEKRKAQFAQIAEDFRHFDQVEQRLNLVQAPTLIVWGEADQLLDVSSATIWHQQLPHSELSILEGVGHMPMVERPEQTAKRVQDFLKGLEK